MLKLMSDETIYMYIIRNMLIMYKKIMREGTAVYVYEIHFHIHFLFGTMFRRFPTASFYFIYLILS